MSFDETKHRRDGGGKFAAHSMAEQDGALAEDEQAAPGSGGGDWTSKENPFTLVAQLPESFHETYGDRPRRFHSHEEASAWLAKMEDATLDSADGALKAAELTGSRDMLGQAKQYFAANRAIASLQTSNHADDKTADALATHVAATPPVPQDEWDAEPLATEPVDDLGFDPNEFHAEDVEAARARLERIGREDPEAGEWLRTELMRDSLTAIENSGPENAHRIAAAARRITSVRIPGWSHANDR